MLNILLEVLARAVRQEKEIKGIQVGNKEAKQSLQMVLILCVENPKHSTQKKNLLDTKSTHKSQLLYTNNKQSEKEMAIAIPFTMATKG